MRMTESLKRAHAIDINVKRIIQDINSLKTKERISREIVIIAASKTFPKEDIFYAKKAGIYDFGENYVQEAEVKFENISGIRKHFIGHLQTNKVKKAVKIFDVIQTIDSLKIAEKINEEAGLLKKCIDCFIEINFAKEETKSGIFPENTIDFISKLRKFQNINVIGLMTMAPKENFKEIKRLFDKTGLKYLSMGMSNDYLEAIKNGSNMIRLGRAIFGERFKK